MKKNELASFYEDISEIGREYGAEIDEPIKTTKYGYIRSSLETLANISERFRKSYRFLC